MITLYHNPRCSKSRAALALLRAKGTEPAVRLYLEEPPSIEELNLLLQQLDMNPRALLRKGEEAYATLQLDDEQLSDAQLIAAMHEHPKLIERPIAIKGDKALVGRPPENVLALL